MKLFEEYQRLIIGMPHPRGVFSLAGFDNYNNFGDYIFRSTNIYWGFDSAQSNDCSYITFGDMCKDTFDCYRCVKCEQCYECVDCYKCYDNVYCDGNDRCLECYFCSRCQDSNNCFGCVLLKNKQYCIFDKQYSKEEYYTQIKELLKRPVDQNLKDLFELSLKFPFLFIRQSLDSTNVNTPYGNYIYSAINSYYCFDSSNLKNCGYIYDSDFMENCWDCSGRSYKCVDCYECIDSAESNNCFNCNNVTKCFDCEHCYWCVNCHDCIGCVMLKDKSYCILNRQLDQNTYQRVRQLLKQNINLDLEQYIKS